jgi:hypothetical protein
MRTVALIVAAVFSLAHLFGQTSRMPFAIIQGQVRDPSGAAVSAASVTVVSKSGETGAAVTDMQGRYHLGGLSPGSYTLRIVARGFALYQSSPVDVATDQSITLNA